jgi:hypothetical protein
MGLHPPAPHCAPPSYHQHAGMGSLPSASPIHTPWLSPTSRQPQHPATQRRHCLLQCHNIAQPPAVPQHCTASCSTTTTLQYHIDLPPAVPQHLCAAQGAGGPLAPHGLDHQRLLEPQGLGDGGPRVQQADAAAHPGRVSMGGQQAAAPAHPRGVSMAAGPGAALRCARGRGEQWLQWQLLRARAHRHAPPLCLPMQAVCAHLPAVLGPAAARASDHAALPSVILGLHLVRGHVRQMWVALPPADCSRRLQHAAAPRPDRCSFPGLSDAAAVQLMMRVWGTGLDRLDRAQMGDSS